MKTKFVMGLALSLAATCVVHAGISSVSCEPDADGAISIGQWAWDSELGELTISEIQSGVPGRVYPVFYTDSIDDPAAWILKEVVNQTNFVWTDYHINIYMPNAFDITSAMQPPGWNVQITAPILDGDRYHGALDFVQGAGQAIGLGETAQFGARISWLIGDGDFCVEQIPTPEPTALALLLIGGLAVLCRR